MIDENQNVYLIDFDRLRVSSIDYELDAINVMKNHPEMVLHFGDNILSPKDLDNLFPLFKTYYPELFDFPHFENRMTIYSIKRYLAMLEHARHKEPIVSILSSLVKGERNEKAD